MSETIVWLREDLRLADNPALTEAVKRNDAVTLLFILDEESPGFRHLGEASKWWLHESLSALGADCQKLGARLVLKRGSAATILPQLVHELGATALFWNRRYGGAERELDTQLKSSLRDSGLEVRSFQANLLHEPWALLTGAGNPYTVFTPYYRSSLERPHPRSPLPAPTRLSSSAHEIESDALENWMLQPTFPDWAGGFRELWQPGEDGAHARLESFLEERVSQYAENRDIPAKRATSELSAHLRFGEISPFQIWHSAHRARQANPSAEPGLASFLRELGWREFSYNLLFHNPDLATKNFNKKFDIFPWWNEAHSPEFDAWKAGRTGIPLVDAGMRELWHTGTMHNRVRMVAASFLTKNLRIDWRLGEQWFWNTLVDADPANNPASWQWVAGCGADAAPYFRVFNPELQAAKFDPDNTYIRRWVPEAFDPEAEYHPIVDLKQSRADALAAYTIVRGAASSQAETVA